MIVDMHNLLKHLQDDTKLCVCVFGRLSLSFVFFFLSSLSAAKIDFDRKYFIFTF